VLGTMDICWLPESKKLGSIIPQQKLGHGGMAPYKQTTELNIVETDDQEDHKVEKLSKEQPS